MSKPLREKGVAFLIGERLSNNVHDGSAYWCTTCKKWWTTIGSVFPISSELNEIAEWSCRNCDEKIYRGPRGREWIRQLDE